jgi:regulator of vacuolar morphogenesis
MPYTISIPTTSLSAPTPSSPKVWTQYHLTITTPLRKSVLLKRYSDFVALHDALKSSCGAAPPATLPSKSWFSRTVDNPDLTESRRAGLEAYVRDIEAAPDAKWRESNPYRLFLNFPPSSQATSAKRSSQSSASAEDAAAAPPAMSSAAWLDLHAAMKQHIQDARAALARRESAANTTGAHEASAAAKKALVKAHTLILRLSEGLKGLEGGGGGGRGRGGGERLGEGEVRRRRDLVARARKEREALEGVLNAWVGVRALASSGAAGEAGMGTGTGTGMKNELFAGAKMGTSPSTAAGSTTMPGAFPGPAPFTRTGRVIGGPPAKETGRTRELDNTGVLQLQEQIMRDQDMDVEELGKVVRRMREMGVAINEELIEQTALLDVVDQDVDRVEGKVNIAKRRLKRIN